MDYYKNLFIQWKKYWATTRGKFFTVTALVLAALILFTNGLPALVFLLVVLLTEYFLYSNPDPKVRFRRNLILFLLGIFEAGTISFVVTGDMGLIGLITGLIFGALAAIIIHITLTLGMIVGAINAIKYYRVSKRISTPPTELTPT